MHFVLACGSESKYVLQIKAYRFRASSCDFTFGNVQLNLSVRIKKVHAKYKECLMALTQHCRSLLQSKLTNSTSDGKNTDSLKTAALSRGSYC